MGYMNIIQVPAHPSNYTASNTTKTGIVFHWIVGEISASDAIFSRANSKVSAHYSVGSNGEVHQHVANKHIAWHAGNWEANKKYIGIEHAGGQLINGQRKKPTQKCHDTSVQLCVQLCQSMGIKKLVLGQNAFRHNHFSATQCCGSLDVEYIINKTNSILAGNLPTFGFTLQVKNNNIYLKDWNSDQAMMNVPYRYTVYIAGVDGMEQKLGTWNITLPKSSGNPLVVDCDKALYRVDIAGYSQSVDLRVSVKEVKPELEDDLGPGVIEPPVQNDPALNQLEIPVDTGENITITLPQATQEPTVPQKDYDELVGKVVDLVRQQNLETWSWNKFFVGMSKVGVYELLLSIAVSISLAYLEQGDASLSTLLVGGAISVLKALKQALRG